MIRSVVVVDITLKAVISCTVPLGESTTCAVDSGFFIAPTTSAVPHTLISAPDCGSVGGKRFTLTETCKGSIGKRVHEGFAPSDKQACRLIVNCCRDRISGLINKAANGIKGKTPMLTPNRVTYRTQTNHHPYTLSLLLSKGFTHMNKQEANQVLNQVREGLLHPQSVIIKALTITGDIHARCTNLESDTSARTDDRNSPFPLPSSLQIS
jgi:hypothetical protein